MNKIMIFKTLLIIQTITVLIYTLFTFRNEGVNLLQVFFYNITAVNWNGQFNIDFLSYLMLSAIWIMWRNKFSSNSIFFRNFGHGYWHHYFCTLSCILIEERKG